MSLQLSYTPRLRRALREEPICYFAMTKIKKMRENRAAV
jgi:hypothetical protein